jgi:hypothetical protein
MMVHPASSQPSAVGQSTAHPHPHIPEGSTLYDFSVNDVDGNMVSLEEFRMIPTLLIVATSIECVASYMIGPVSSSDPRRTILWYLL